MSTVESDCIVCCCPCITVWAGFYFAYRGITDGSVFCYNKARRACSSKGIDDEKEAASALDHPPPSVSTLQYWGSQASHKDLAMTRSSTTSHPYPSFVGQPDVVQLPPKAVPSMRVTPMGGGGSDCGGSELERSYYARRGSFYAGSTYSRKTNEDGYEGASSVSDLHGTHHDKKQEAVGGCANRTVLERVPESPIPPRTATSDGKS